MGERDTELYLVTTRKALSDWLQGTKLVLSAMKAWRKRLSDEALLASNPWSQWNILCFYWIKGKVFIQRWEHVLQTQTFMNVVLLEISIFVWHVSSPSPVCQAYSFLLFIVLHSFFQPKDHLRSFTLQTFISQSILGLDGIKRNTKTCTFLKYSNLSKFKFPT